ncbi:C39 family peptidase [Variovorax boronicumulans]|jgi:predicted double-glycine peptidase|uniref:C39 family peptidase n=1 Tax=Variovorax boronicumulans TaxID=436515 RepID=UPI001C55A926
MSPLRLLCPAALLCLAASGTGLAQDRAVRLTEMGGASYAVPVRSMQQIKQAGTLLQQYDFSCGSAAVATLLTHHYGRTTSEQEVFEQMFAAGDQDKIRREGFSLLDMKRFLHTRGFEADGFQQPLDKLRESGVPAIALITENGYHHFVVVKGLDNERVLIGDPANGTRAMARAAFEAQWKQKLLFVVHNRMEIARFNLASDWRAAPAAPLASGLLRDALLNSMPRNGPGQF